MLHHGLLIAECTAHAVERRLVSLLLTERSKEIAGDLDLTLATTLPTSRHCFASSASAVAGLTALWLGLASVMRSAPSSSAARRQHARQPVRAAHRTRADPSSIDGTGMTSRVATRHSGIP
jgi:hypothetical protein